MTSWGCATIIWKGSSVHNFKGFILLFKKIVIKKPVDIFLLFQ